MKNPFLVSYNSRDDYYYIDEKSSINKLVIAQIPLKGIEDGLEGQKAGYIFNAKDIVKDIRETSKLLGIKADTLSDQELMKEVEDRFLDDDDSVREVALGIAKKYGYRLGIILLVLKTGLEANRKARPEWTDEHWAYWANLKKVILAGGLTQNVFGEKVRTYANDIFNMAGVEPYEMLLFNDSAHLGVKGCASLVKEKNKSNLLFDFGQTRIKRSLIKVDKGEIKEKLFLNSFDSKYMQFVIENDAERKKEATKLHNYIKQVIVDTFKELSKQYDIGDEIIVSIASYVIDGRLNQNRGGYAKLYMLTDNYEKYLAEELSKELGRNIQLKLVHDGTAISLYFKEYRETVCLSLGTAIGVGHPSKKIQNI